MYELLKIGGTTLLKEVTGNISSQTDSLREAWCVNMLSSYMVDVNEEYVKGRCYFLEKTLERRMTGEFLLYQKVR